LNLLDDFFVDAARVNGGVIGGSGHWYDGMTNSTKNRFLVKWNPRLYFAVRLKR